MENEILTSREEEYSYDALPEFLENESQDEYIERLVEIDKSFGKKAGYLKEECDFKNDLKRYLCVEMEMKDRQIAELLEIKVTSVRSWRIYDLGLMVNGNNEKSRVKYPRTEREKELVASFVLKAIAMSKTRGINYSLEEARAKALSNKIAF